MGNITAQSVADISKDVNQYRKFLQKLEQQAAERVKQIPEMINSELLPQIQIAAQSGLRCWIVSFATVEEENEAIRILRDLGFYCAASRQSYLEEAPRTPNLLVGW